MSFADWDQNEIIKVEKGLSILGWGWDIEISLTSDEAHMVADIAYDALEKESLGQLSPQNIEALSTKVFAIMQFPIMNTIERARKVTTSYKKSCHLSSLIPLIDESCFCFYRGYYTASLALLFVILEKCLRSIAGWKVGDPDISFKTLKESVNNLPNKYRASIVYNMVSSIYARYDAQNPPDFFFNRHGLLHGLRDKSKFDIMNCTRIYKLFDYITFAENISTSLFGEDFKEFENRDDHYKSCL